MADMTPAYLGGTLALTDTPVVGQSEVERSDVYTPGIEDLAQDEIRVSILGSGLRG